MSSSPICNSFLKIQFNSIQFKVHAMSFNILIQMEFSSIDQLRIVNSVQECIK
jgi:hypothetical protein